MNFHIPFFFGDEFFQQSKAVKAVIVEGQCLDDTSQIDNGWASDCLGSSEVTHLFQNLYGLNLRGNFALESRQLAHTMQYALNSGTTASLRSMSQCSCTDFSLCRKRLQLSFSFKLCWTHLTCPVFVAQDARRAVMEP